MSKIFENAVTSIILGIEDFETDDRMLSAARNYYAGLLLLAKECLVHAAPEADPMHIIGAKFKPRPDGNGGVEYIVDGYTTVDLGQIKKRFKDFDLTWPDVKIERLQRFRNDLEHYHLKEPAGKLREAIASSFPMLVDFFKILGKEPQEHLADVWDTITAERATFEKLRADCLASWKDVKWPAPVENLDEMMCPNCESLLVGQIEAGNTDYENVEGKCSQCGNEIDRESLIKMVVDVSYGPDDYLMALDGQNPIIANCHECGADKTYVDTGEISICFSCVEGVAGECGVCDKGIGVHEYISEYPNLCSCCAYKLEKVMRE